MRLLKNGSIEPTEELTINGASVVFYTVRLLDNSITDADVSIFCNDSCYQQIQEAQYGYIERMFSVDNPSDNIFFKLSEIDTIHNVRASSDTSINLNLNHYVLLYSQRAILLQTIFIFDTRGIIETNNAKTPTDDSLSVTNLLALIHDIKNINSDAGKAFYQIIENRFAQICNALKICDSSSFCETKQNEQNIAIQIWDIASLPSECDRNSISGDYLEERYELELAALLLLYNEHYTKDELWKNLSSSQIRKAVANKTDVLNDHRILASERICIEISQVDEPSFRDISKHRLSVYGYDSTSTFLWGYLSIIEIGLKNCVSVLSELCQCILEDAHVNILNLSKKRQQVLRLKDQYLSIDEMCIEGRHKEFIGRGITKKHLNEVIENINKADQHFQDSSNLAISETTSKSSVEISELFKAFRRYTEEQDRSNDIVSVLGLILALASVFAVAEYIEELFSVDYLCGRLIILGSIILLFAITALFVVINKKKKSRSTKKSKSQKTGKRNRRIESDN
ncbi:MAG: hypothetical protein KIG25_04285 [Eubacteriales bacterium]|nr:hypothetical protein [Eubacteriales bacterium]